MTEVVPADPSDSSVAPARWRRPRAREIGLAVLAAIAAAGLWLSVAEPEHHADGHGPLESLGDGTAIGMTSDVDGAGRTTTFGLELCLRDATDRAVVESISPTVAVGTGVRFLGARMRALDWSDGSAPPEMIGSVDGFPPRSVDVASLSDAIGFAVTQHCKHPDPTTYTELLVGLQGDPGARGGWHGIDVGYRVGWRHRVVSIRYDLLLCPADDQDCDRELTEE